jgi:hypothetical protein
VHAQRTDPTDGDIMQQRLAAIAARLGEMREVLDQRLPLMSPPGKDADAEPEQGDPNRLN